MDVIIHADGSAELMHYGVKGMKWGVRRASRQLRKARTQSDYETAAAKLEKHRTKGTAKLNKLEKKRVKLDKKLYKATMKDNLKSAKLEKKATKLDKKAAKMVNKSVKSKKLTDDERTDLRAKAEKMTNKSSKMHTKASVLKANYEHVKAKVEKNEAMQQAFRTQLSNIDQAYVKAGKKYCS